MPARETAIPMIAIVILPATLAVSANPPTLSANPPTQSTNPTNAIPSSLLILVLPRFALLKQHNRAADEDRPSGNEQDTEPSADSGRHQSKTDKE
jgi:hypothetical protein